MNNLIRLVLSFCFISGLYVTAFGEEKTEERPKAVVIKYEPKQVSKVIPLRTVDYATIEAVCKPMLTKTGTMAYLKVRNSVIVFDYEKNVKKIAKIIDQIDLPAVNIRIDVDFVGTNSGSKDKVYGKVNYKKYPSKSNQVIIRNGKIVKPDTIKFGAVKQTNLGSRNTSQFILTKSGSSAQLWVGKRIVDPTWLRWRPLRPTHIITGPGGTIVVPGSDNDIVWRDIGSSLWVLPTYLGNGKIDVEVYPVVSYLEDEPDDDRHRGKKGKKGKRRKRPKRQTVRVQDVSTHLTLQSGQRVSMGGVISSNKNFYKNLFGPNFLSKNEENSILDMYITATAIKPGGSTHKSYIPKTSRDTSPIQVDKPTREDPQEMFKRRRQ